MSFPGSAANAKRDFEEQQTNSVVKATGNGETPTKIKHVRIIILGSYKEEGSGTFWTAVSRLPLKTNKVTCWKFCHVLHKLLRDGHPHALYGSLKYIVYLEELGRLWEQSLDCYGILASRYCKLLVQRLTFHHKHPKLRGNLRFTDNDISESTSNDTNGYFEFAVEVLDLMDELLNLQSAVIESLDHSRTSSGEESKQCRLYPLILCIQDSCHLYNCLVKLLFRLHHALAPQVLDGHRERFSGQFNRIRQFYQFCTNRQYFKTLVQVPSLPDNPPNFLVASELSHYRQPVAVVSGEDDEMDEKSVTPTSAPPIPIQKPVTPTKPVRPPSTKDETLLVMDSETPQGATVPVYAIDAEFKQHIHNLQTELERVKTKTRERIAELQRTTADLTTQLDAANKSAELDRSEKAAMKHSLDEKVHECTHLRAQLQAFKGSEDAASQLAKAESATKESENKLKKLKEAYSVVREDHIALLRTHAEDKKQWEADKKATVQVSETLQRTVQELEQLLREKEELIAALQLSAERASVEAAELQQKLADAVQQHENFAEQIKAATTEATDSRTAASRAETEHSHLAMRLNEALSRQHSATERATLLQKQLGTARDEALKLGAELARTAKELEQLQHDNKSLQDSSDRETLKAVVLKQQLADAEQQHQRLAEQLDVATKEATDSRSAASHAETERLSVIRRLDVALSRQQDVEKETQLLQQQLAAARAEAQDSGAALSRTAQELERLQRDKENLQNRYDIATSKMTELKQHLTGVEQQRKRLAEQLEVAAKEATDSRSAASDAETECLSLISRLDEALSRQQDVEKETQLLQQQLTAARAEAQESGAALSDLATKLKAAKNEAAEWKSAAENIRPKTLVDDLASHSTEVHDSSMPQSVNDRESSA